MLENNEMPPKKSKQLSAEQKAMFIAWIHRYLDAEAHAGAGDPGRVVLRRLSNAEYDNTVRDLTSVYLEPTQNRKDLPLSFVEIVCERIRPMPERSLESRNSMPFTLDISPTY